LRRIRVFLLTIARQRLPARPGSCGSAATKLSTIHDDLGRQAEGSSKSRGGMVISKDDRASPGVPGATLCKASSRGTSEGGFTCNSGSCRAARCGTAQSSRQPLMEKRRVLARLPGRRLSLC
jgi:hypothetical protein